MRTVFLPDSTTPETINFMIDEVHPPCTQTGSIFPSVYDILLYLIKFCFLFDAAKRPNFDIVQVATKGGGGETTKCPPWIQSCLGWRHQVCSNHSNGNRRVFICYLTLKDQDVSSLSKRQYDEKILLRNFGNTVPGSMIWYSPPFLWINLKMINVWNWMIVSLENDILIYILHENKC